MNLIAYIGLRWLARLLLAATLTAFSVHAAYSAQEGSLSVRSRLPQSRSVPLEWGRDPFIPLIKDLAADGLKLTAVFYNKSRPSAIVNDKIVYRGSFVAGQKVIAIGKTHVILRNEAGRTRIEMGGMELSDE